MNTQYIPQLLIKISLLLISALSLFSCEDTIEVDLKNGESLLIVDGWITDQPGPHVVTLSRTAPYFSNTPAPKVTGAVLYITDDAGNVEALTETGNGKYTTGENFQGRVGSSYTLSIQVDGSHFIAETSIRRPFVIDSLTQLHRKETISSKEGYYVQLNAQEQPGTGDNFRLKIYKNGALLNSPEDLTVAEDRYVDGNYLKEVDIHADPFQVDDKIRVEAWSITRDAYEYYSEMRQQIENGGLMESPHANIPTNVKSVDAAGAGKVAGYFGGASVQVKEITIQPSTAAGN